MPLILQKVFILLRREFGKADVFFTVSKGWHNVLSLLLVPLAEIRYLIDLLGTHQHVQYGSKPLDFLFLVANCIQEFLLVILVLDLNISELGQTGNILFLNVLEPAAHLVDFIIQPSIVLLDV